MDHENNVPEQSVESKRRVNRILRICGILCCISFSILAFLLKAYFSGELFLLAALLFLPSVRDALSASGPNKGDKKICWAARYAFIPVLCAAIWTACMEINLPDIEIYKNIKIMQPEKVLIQNRYPQEEGTGKSVKIIWDISEKRISIICSEIIFS